MQGTAHIVVKDKNGKTKSDIKAHNTITNAFYNAMQSFCQNLNEENKENLKPLQLSPSTFGGITIHDQIISDDKDIQLTRLSGGQKATISGNTNYSGVVTNSVTKKKITNVWAWGIDTAFTMKSIALRHNDFISKGYFGRNGGVAGARGLKLAADKYAYPSYYYNGSASNTSYYAGVVYDRESDLSIMERTLLHRKTDNKYDKLMPLYNDECALINGANVIVVDDADVVNYATATAKRTFAVSQFTYLSTDNVIASVPTPEKDYLISANNTTVYIHEIPRTAITDTIAPVLTITMSTQFNNYKSIVVCGRYAFIGYQTSAGAAEIRFNSDGTISHREGYTKAVGLYDGDTYSNKMQRKACYLYLIRNSNAMVDAYLIKYMPAKYGSQTETGEVEISGQILHDFGIWHNQTYLNLSTPIALEVGDTLTISYSISVGE